MQFVRIKLFCECVSETIVSKIAWLQYHVTVYLQVKHINTLSNCTSEWSYGFPVFHMSHAQTVPPPSFHKSPALSLLPAKAGRP